MQEGYVSLLPYANDRENTHACDGRHTRGHDRSCLDMSEADGVDGGAICKRGFIHLQFAAKPEAPEAERHLGSRILESYVSSKGSFHNPLLDAYTGKIERTLSRVSAGTSVVFSGAIKSPTVKDFV
ncbi:hypothetical protein V1477_011054 [Vespula maculifrons]|uniref:Uncharacterized protein n=1 Tax=Vespula maculifrons TaxID=7453 RepID=A0ABD2C3Q6_VESMC